MKKHLPNGWKELQIKDVLDYERPDLYIVKNNIYKDKGVAVLTANKSFILGYTDEKDNIYNNIPVIIFDDFTTETKYVNFPFKVKSSAIKILKSKKGYNLKFIYEVLNRISFNCKVHKRYYISEYQNLNILVPPLDEQKRIADILSTFDDLIENLTKLIEKKEIYKKGVMQRVLSGKVRFNGFTDEWEIFKLKEIGKLISGSGFPIKYQGKKSGEIAFIKVSDMNLKDNSIFIKNANNYINENELKELKAKIIPIGSIVFAKIGEAIKLERKRIISIKTCIDNNMSALVPLDNFNKKYIFYLLSNYKLSKHSNFSALPSLNMSDISEIEFNIPSLEEQNKIAELLTLIDKDIEILKQLLHLRKLQKKGVMQKLLTGEVRI